MLAKRYRFHSRGGVRYTYQRGKTLRAPMISLVYTENTRGRQRFGVVVSKKVLKSAVGRNRIRRRVYEAIRGVLAEMRQPVDGIFVVYSREIYDMPFEELRESVTGLLRQAGLI